ncbi:tRNA pseudouridine(55) synthase TruB [Erythrobacter litoralis]|uniref:tRNA pseudouridine synthase B n=1 Tax=Erythrobacter litoralis (strain HTCC2594) TaxID=314225 RepID=Q2NBZ4_ERYLH|nr:tRNA pseudouridine(55) synthase TruB [Erythrobacter litoralis]ABC62797.1 tRNA pseudouridine synthase B [Erythrobacter litoralis HTCC2594]
MSDLKPAPHGWIILDKPRGLGSTQAVGAVKRNLREGGYAKTKVGHGGTLDPEAEGVLPIALGEATKLAGRMLDASKIYEFTVQFGEETDTLDAEGEITARSDRRPPMAAIAAVLEHFTGEIEQVPPKYSALMVDGKRAYDRARAGEEVELKTRRVTIYDISLSRHPREGGDPANLGDHDESQLDPRLRGGDGVGFLADADLTSTFQTTSGRPDPYDPGAPLELADAITLTAHVSKGTYIRSLARDIARALGTVGHVTYLRRIKAGPFAEFQAISLDKLNEIGKGAPLQDLLLPLEAGLDDIPALTLDSDSAQAVRQGRVLSELPQTDGLYLAKLDDVPVALVELSGGTARVVRGFNLPDVAE